MKKVLCATTALVAVAMMGGQAMAAGTPMTASNFNLTLGGNLNFGLRWESHDPRQNDVASDGVLYAVIYAVNTSTAAIGGLAAGATGYLTSYSASSSLIILSRTFSVASTAPTNGVAVNANDAVNAGIAAGNHYRNNDFELTGLLSIQGDGVAGANGTKAGFYIGLNVAGTELANAAGKTNTGADRQTSFIEGQGWGTGGPSCSVTDAARASQCGVNRSNFVGENYMYLDGRWGKLQVGGYGAGPAAALQVGLTSTYNGVNALLLSDPDATPAINPAGNNRITASGFASTINTTTEYIKATWMLPAVMGIRTGIIYTPDLTMDNTTSPTFDNYNGSSKSRWDAYGQWAGTVAGMATQVGAGYTITNPGDTRQDSPVGGLTTNSSFPGFQNTGIDISADYAWNIGVNVKPNSATNLSAFIRNGMANGVSVNPGELTKRYGVAATYTLGKDWVLGASMVRSQQEVRDRNPGAGVFGELLGTDKGTQYDFGVNYNGLGAGKTLSVGMRSQVYTSGGDNIHLLLTQCSANNAGVSGAAACDSNNIKSYDIKYTMPVAAGVTQTFGLQQLSYQKHAGLDPYPASTTATGALITTAMRF